jgi:hypothetical protein
VLGIIIRQFRAFVLGKYGRLLEFGVGVQYLFLLQSFRHFCSRHREQDQHEENRLQRFQMVRLIDSQLTSSISSELTTTENSFLFGQFILRMA